MSHFISSFCYYLSCSLKDFHLISKPKGSLARGLTICKWIVSFHSKTVSSITIHAGKPNRIRERTAVPMAVQALLADVIHSQKYRKSLSATIARFIQAWWWYKTVAKLVYSSDSPPKGSNDQRKPEGNQEPKILPPFLIRWRGKGHLGLLHEGLFPGLEVQQFPASLSSYQEDGSGWLRDPVAPGAFHTSRLHLAVISPMKSSLIY